jgi:hypothetical protein
MAIRKNRRQVVMNAAEIADVYANWPAATRNAEKEAEKAADLARAVAEAEEIVDRLPEFSRQGAYVYYNQATRRHGFYFAPDDATAERYAQRCGLAEQTNWLIVAVVPSKHAA